jgi:hypothetical protein
MIRQTQQDFNALAIIEEYLVVPATVTSDGLVGRFDTLRVALEHLQTHGQFDGVLAIKAAGEELQFSEDGLTSLTEAFAVWLEDAGLPQPGQRRR